jgi:hypothetical protein
MSELPRRFWRETEQFVQCRDEIAPNTRRWDEVFRGIEAALLTNAEAVSWEVTGTDLRVMSTDTRWGFPDVPALWIYFRVVEDGTCCELLYMLEVPADEEDEQLS